MPSLVILIFTNQRKKFMYSDRQKMQSRCNLVLSSLSILSIIGCLIFIFAGAISEWYFKTQVATNLSARTYALVLGIIGFVLMHCGLIVSEDCITEIMLWSKNEDPFKEVWVFRWKSIGKIAGFFFASLDIFETYTLNLYYVFFI